jgi:hypothetical protein
MFNSALEKNGITNPLWVVYARPLFDIEDFEDDFQFPKADVFP